MNKRIVIAVLALITLVCAGLTLAASGTAPAKEPAASTHAAHKSDGHMTGKHATVLVPDELEWTEVPNSGGAQVARVTGDMTRGAYSCFARFPAGSVHPLHTHAADIKCVVISGTMLYSAENGPEQKLGPGSYVMIPGGLKHTSGADAGSDVVIYQMQAGRFDMVPVTEQSASH